jgi:hypothetical protein
MLKMAKSSHQWFTGIGSTFLRQFLSLTIPCIDRFFQTPFALQISLVHVVRCPHFFVNACHEANPTNDAVSRHGNNDNQDIGIGLSGSAEYYDAAGNSVISEHGADSHSSLEADCPTDISDAEAVSSEEGTLAMLAQIILQMSTNIQS